MTTEARPQHRWWGLVVVYSAAIFIASSSALPNITKRDIPGFDKILHFGAFGVWGLLFAYALGRSAPRWRVGWVMWTAMLGSVIYGVSDEVHQAFVPGRDADPLDVLADGAGGVAAALVYGWWRRWRK
jgi:VanZ family protein